MWCWYVRKASGFCGVIEISLIKGKKHDKTRVAGYERAKISFKDAIPICVRMCIYRVSQEECARLREGVPYVKVYRYNPKHLCPKLKGYGVKGARKVWSSCGSTYCTWFA